ncbi:putative pheromone protein [Chaetomium fimeti]|uniref:Pheromone protein n=1 Tax=Chaetomium fimeti TaxID=1854472 RepID=A0AAE0HQC1_9PEZI|nr:putative pheromone protein [Chaetomium fimeti]
MKFTLPIALLAAAVSVDAAAVADQDRRYCSAEGQACDTVKRAAEAFSGAIQQNTNLVTRDETQGETAWIARRQLHELALAIAASHDDPAAFYSALGFQGATPTDDAGTDNPTEKREAEPWCTQFLGMPCWKRNTTPAPDKVKREAEPWCKQFLGMPCWKRDDAPSHHSPGAEKKREADAEPWCTQFLGQPCWKRTSPAGATTDVDKRDAEADAAPWCKQFLGMPCWKRDADPGWCRQFLGMPCWKRDDETSGVEKREAEAEAAAEPDRFCTRFTGSSCWKRDGGAVAADEVKRCSTEGQACWKAKRAAAAVINAIDQGNAQKMARDADPGWCRQFLGMPCWKRAATCNGPAGVCTKATRDLHAMYNAARTIIEA